MDETTIVEFSGRDAVTDPLIPSASPTDSRRGFPKLCYLRLSALRCRRHIRWWQSRSAELRAAAVKCRDAQAARRMLALALVLEGVDRTTAAETCGMDRQTLRDWVHR